MRPGVAMITVLIVLTGLGVSADLAAQDMDVGEFDSDNVVSFPPHDSLTMRKGGTIEFWVGADWIEDPGYDPAILSNAGPDGPLYLVAMLRDRDGLALVTGDRVELVPFNFSDDQMHYVAIVDTGEGVNVMIDGLFVAELDMAFADLPSSGFWIGRADENMSPFIGAIANLRLWDVSVDPDDLVRFAMRDVEDDFAEEGGPHPDLEFLIGYSDFENGGFFLTGFDPDVDAVSPEITAANETY